MLRRLRDELGVTETLSNYETRLVAISGHCHALEYLAEEGLLNQTTLSAVLPGSKPRARVVLEELRPAL